MFMIPLMDEHRLTSWDTENTAMNLLDYPDIHQYRIYVDGLALSTRPRRIFSILLAEVDTAHRTIAHKQYLGFSMVENISPTTDSTAGACK